MALLRRYRPWTEEEHERIRSMVAAGASVLRVAAAVGRPMITTREKARALGCPFPHQVKARVARRRLWEERI
jgi:hypothetical protein